MKDDIMLYVVQYLYVILILLSYFSKAIRQEIWRKTQLGNIAKKSKSSEDFVAFNEQKILVNISAIPDYQGLSCRREVLFSTMLGIHDIL